MTALVEFEDIEEAFGATVGSDMFAVQLAIEAASEAIRLHTNRTFLPTAAPVTRSFPVSDGEAVVDDIISVDTVVLDGVAFVDYTLTPLNAAGLGRPYTRMGNLGTAKLAEVTATYGWPGAVPWPVRQAALLQALRLVQRRHAPFGVAGSPEAGSEMRLLARLDPDVEMLVRPYVRSWYVA